MWNYRQTEAADVDVTGFGVEAIDGSIGKVDAATYDTRLEARSSSTRAPGSSARRSCCPQACRPDRLRRREGLRPPNEDEIKNAPEYDDTSSADLAYRDRLASYYDPEGAGYRHSGHARPPALAAPDGIEARGAETPPPPSPRPHGFQYSLDRLGGGNRGLPRRRAWPGPATAYPHQREHEHRDHPRADQRRPDVAGDRAAPPADPDDRDDQRQPRRAEEGQG